MAYGFEPVRVPSGHPTPNCISNYTIADGYATALLRGDLVKVVAAGTIERAAAGDTFVGSFYGVEYITSTGETKFDSYWPASQAIATGTEALAYVFDDPNTIFKVESDQDTTALAAADVGTLADAIVAAGSTTTKRSGMSLDSSSKGTGSGGQFKVLNSAQLDGSFTSAGTVMDVYVRPNEHFYMAAVDGV